MYHCITFACVELKMFVLSLASNGTYENAQTLVFIVGNSLEGLVETMKYKKL